MIKYYKIKFKKTAVFVVVLVRTPAINIKKVIPGICEISAGDQSLLSRNDGKRATERVLQPKPRRRIPPTLQSHGFIRAALHARRFGAFEPKYGVLRWPHILFSPTSFWMDRFGTVRSARSVGLRCVGASRADCVGSSVSRGCWGRLIKPFSFFFFFVNATFTICLSDYATCDVLTEKGASVSL